MGVNTEKFIKKPLVVDAARITAENFDEIVAWCQGEVLTDEIPGQGTTKKYIKVRVHNPKNPRQTKAFIGDWLLYTERGYKVYTNKAFRASFDPLDQAGITMTTINSTPEIPAAPAVIDNNGVEATLERAPIVEDEPVVDAPIVSDSDSAPPQQTEDGRRVLTEAEQREMDSAELEEILRSGQAVLAQDLV